MPTNGARTEFIAVNRLIAGTLALINVGLVVMLSLFYHQPPSRRTQSPRHADLKSLPLLIHSPCNAMLAARVV